MPGMPGPGLAYAGTAMVAGTGGGASHRLGHKDLLGHKDSPVKARVVTLCGQRGRRGVLLTFYDWLPTRTTNCKLVRHITQQPGRRREDDGGGGKFSAGAAGAAISGARPSTPIRVPGDRSR
jgi:hypothetical protein